MIAAIEKLSPIYRGDLPRRAISRLPWTLASRDQAASAMRKAAPELGREARLMGSNPGKAGNPDSRPPRRISKNVTGECELRID